MATEPASPHHPNEDFVAATPTSVVLLDGAGTGALETGCIHGVAWFAHQLGGQLTARIDDVGVDLVSMLADAIAATAAQHRHSCDLNHPATPSATVVLCRLTDNEIEHLVLADSVLLLIDNVDHVSVVCDDREAQVNRTYRETMDAEPIGSKAHTIAREVYYKALLANRNRSDGFWVAASDPSAAAEAMVGARPCEEVRAAVLMSDGASRLVDRFGLATWEHVVSLVQTNGPHALIQAVRVAERSDVSGVRWPRGKATDDATAAWCDLG